MQEIIFNYMLDLRKKDIDKHDRAKIIDEYLKANNISQRELARQLGIPHVTLQDWLMMTRLPKRQYTELLDEGITETKIYKVLRAHKDKKGSEIVKIALETQDETSLDLKLIAMTKELSSYIHKPEVSSDTSYLLSRLKNVINKIEMYISKRRK